MSSANESKMVEVVDSDPKKDEVPLHPIIEALQKDGDDPSMISAILDNCAKGEEPLKASDKAGMTPVMYAAWKKKIKTLKFLIEQGADVNGGDHEHEYTALHFAALAGSEEACKILVEHGAKTDKINSVRRTPAQMAGFVGNGSCVAIINNYVPKEDVFYFTRKQPLEEKPKLPIAMAKPIHNLVMSMNTHPVRIALILKENPVLLENVGKVCEILELMSDREFKNRRDVNEVLSLKYHIIHYIVKDIKKQMDKDSQSSTEKKTPFIDRWIKSMLLGRETDGYAVFQEDFLRQGIKEFPYKESTLFKMLVTSFSQSRNYGEHGSAADCINRAFNGERGFKDDEDCGTCGNEKASKKCSGCKAIQYCDQVCQKLHWFVHKKYCSKMKTVQEDVTKKEEEKK